MSKPCRIPLEIAIHRGLIPKRLAGTPNHPNEYDFAIVALADLAHVETRTRARNLDRLRAEWEPARWRPIELLDGDTGRFVLRNGNHRLRLARERGEETITAIIERRRE